MAEPKTLMISMSSYVTGRTLGMENAQRSMNEAVKELIEALKTANKAGQQWLKQKLVELMASNPILEAAPGLLTTALAACLGFETSFMLDTGSTHIPKTRSRHFHRVLESQADFWISIDDDVQAPSDTIQAMLDGVNSAEPRMVVAPCILRGGAAVNIEWSPIYATRSLKSGAKLRQAQGGGFALVALNKPAIQALDAYMRSQLELWLTDKLHRDCPYWVDIDGEKKHAIFREIASDERWLGEDIAFCLRAKCAGVQIEGLLTGHTAHDGLVLNLADLEKS